MTTEIKIEATEEFAPKRILQHTDSETSLLGYDEGPDDVFEEDSTPSENQSFHRVDVPSRFDMIARKEKSMWESSQSYFWDFVEYIWPSRSSSTTSTTSTEKK